MYLAQGHNAVRLKPATPKSFLFLYVTMEFPIKFDIVKSEWSIVYIEWTQGIISNKKNLFLKINFVFANSADPDEMLHYAAFHLGLYCLSKYPLRGFSLQRANLLSLNLCFEM